MMVVTLYLLGFLSYPQYILNDGNVFKHCKCVAYVMIESVIVVWGEFTSHKTDQWINVLTLKLKKKDNQVFFRSKV